MVGDEGASVVCDAALHCPKLVHLGLSSCSISIIPIAFQLSAPPSLLIDLRFNPLRSPPYAVADRGFEALTGYWSDLRADHAPMAMDRVRLMLVGEGGVGKTTLAQALSLKPEELSTFHLSLKGMLRFRSCFTFACRSGGLVA